MNKLIVITLISLLTACTQQTTPINLTLTKLNDTECKISDGHATISVKCTNDLDEKIETYNKSKHTSSMDLNSLVSTLIIGKAIQ